MLDVTGTALIASYSNGKSASWNFEAPDGNEYYINTEDKAKTFTIERLDFDEEKQDWVGYPTDYTIDAFCAKFGIKRLVSL